MKPFYTINLSRALEESKRKMKEEIDLYTNEEIVANDVELLVSNVYEKFFIEPVTIYEEEVRKRSIKQGKVRKWIDPFSRIDPNREYITLDGAIIHFYYRYIGERDLFKCQASTFSISGYPEIELDDEYVKFTYEKSLKDMEKEGAQKDILSSVERDLNYIKAGIEYANNDVKKFNASLRDFLKNCINEKKQKVEMFFDFAKMLEVPIEKTDYAKVYMPVQRNIVPIAHEYEKNKTEYTIADKDYQDILIAIKHTGTTFERTPKSYKSMGEEDLRNVLLASLNATYKGNAYGEAFRNKGKTDICIEQDSRAAFVAECKMWTGGKEIESAIRQLDGYLTWRDQKTALIYFVRRKDFLKVTETMEKTLREISVIRQVTAQDKNEFHCEYVSETSIGQIISMRVIMFNMYSD